MLSVTLLDRAPDFDRLRAAVDRASRIVLRLRQRVVVPTTFGSPQWIVDPDFDLDYHLRRVRVPEPGTLRQLLDLAQPILAAPLDMARPLWEATLVEGLSGDEGGVASLVLKLNHSITDGVGGVRLFRELFDIDRNANRGAMPPLPVPMDVTTSELSRQAARRLPIETVTSGLSQVRWVTRAVTGVARDPRGFVSSASRMIGSARRVLGPPPVEPSPLLRRRGLGRRFEYVEFPLARIRKAAKAGGGSVNDAYLAGISGALRLYHEALGVPVDAVPLAMPVNLRRDDDPAGGNRFAGARLALPVSPADPVERIQRIREQVLSVVGEPAISAMSAAAPLLSRLPTSMLGAVSSMVSSTDVQASNVPGFPEQPYVAGARIEKTLPFGPLPGVAMMIVMVSEAGTCFVGVHYDTASVTERDLFVECLRDGFEEVLALAERGPTEKTTSTGSGSRAIKRSSTAAATTKRGEKTATNRGSR
jgi:WS/DGAT/MGAT family acyltransferase